MTLENLLRIGRIKEHPPDTNQPGHHVTVLQSLPKTMGLPGVRLAVLDTLRRKRNLADYTGEDIDGGFQVYGAVGLKPVNNQYMSIYLY
jgi:hypothetical protein